MRHLGYCLSFKWLIPDYKQKAIYEASNNVPPICSMTNGFQVDARNKKETYLVQKMNSYPMSLIKTTNLLSIYQLVIKPNIIIFTDGI